MEVSGDLMCATLDGCLEYIKKIIVKQIYHVKNSDMIFYYIFCVLVSFFLSNKHTRESEWPKKIRTYGQKAKKKFFFIQTYIRSFQYFYIHKIIKKEKMRSDFDNGEKRKIERIEKRRDCLM